MEDLQENELPKRLVYEVSKWCLLFFLGLLKKINEYLTKRSSQREDLTTFSRRIAFKLALFKITLENRQKILLKRPLTA